MKAKITEYKDVHFRSRLEVKWCQFFESLGVSFEYEPELEKTSLGYYVPDFYFRSLKTWVEIKGVEPTEEELTKIKEVCRNTGKSGFIISGYPKIYPAGVEPHLSNAMCYYITNKGKSVKLSLDEIYQFIQDPFILYKLKSCEETGSFVCVSADLMRCIKLQPAKAIFKPNKRSMINHTRTLCKIFETVNSRLNN